MYPFPKLWGCKYKDNILIINNFINKKRENRKSGLLLLPVETPFIFLDISFQHL